MSELVLEKMLRRSMRINTSKSPSPNPRTVAHTRSTIALIFTVAGAAPYGVFPNQPQLYATQGPPPPTYDQTLTHPMMYQPMYGQGYPGGYLAGYPTAYGPLQYYPPLAAAAAYYPAAAMQPAPVRPTIMVPNGFDGTRFDGISQPVLPPPPPGVAANAAQLAAMAGHSVALSQKKGSFLGGGTDGGYAFW
ncbi:hypothetical protein EAI_09409 [Harpegnathos saltator]|uniref:DAZ-associated protein 2 n=1 Tax=Harpegnathos saltator TaxID=610380 RepID=E2BQJ2_HARSA|nr:hypothetical protein EAI_09409 [Harpegnathos saltator]